MGVDNCLMLVSKQMNFFVGVRNLFENILYLP